jgi:hypothetical protein
MGKQLPEKNAVLDAIKKLAKALGRAPSLTEFKKSSGMSPYYVARHFETWGAAVRAAGLEPDSSRMPIPPETLLQDWAMVARRAQHIPTLARYRLEGSHAPGVLVKNFGPWADIPGVFRKWAESRPEWSDVIALIPTGNASSQSQRAEFPVNAKSAASDRKQRNLKLDDRPTYGNPIDFRGLRHEPVNEQGVVFLFGMVARELGYLVEAVQAGYPDCEAKRQVAAGKWQRVRIEFEFESRNFDHPPDGCDVIVCWHDNWPDRPQNLEVLELCKVIQNLPARD